MMDDDASIAQQEGGDNNDMRTILVRLSSTAYDGACSALSFLFVECDIPKDHSPVSTELRKIGMYKKGTK